MPGRDARHGAGGDGARPSSRCRRSPRCRRSRSGRAGRRNGRSGPSAGVRSGMGAAQEWAWQSAWGTGVQGTCRWALKRRDEGRDARDARIPPAIGRSGAPSRPDPVGTGSRCPERERRRCRGSARPGPGIGSAGRRTRGPIGLMTGLMGGSQPVRIAEGEKMLSQRKELSLLGRVQVGPPRGPVSRKTQINQRDGSAWAQWGALAPCLHPSGASPPAGRTWVIGIVCGPSLPRPPAASQRVPGWGRKSERRRLKASMRQPRS